MGLVLAACALALADGGHEEEGTRARCKITWGATCALRPLRKSLRDIPFSYIRASVAHPCTRPHNHTRMFQKHMQIRVENGQRTNVRPASTGCQNFKSKRLAGSSSLHAALQVHLRWTDVQCAIHPSSRQTYFFFTHSTKSSMMDGHAPAANPRQSEEISRDEKATCLHRRRSWTASGRQS